MIKKILAYVFLIIFSLISLIGMFIIYGWLLIPLLVVSTIFNLFVCVVT